MKYLVGVAAFASIMAAMASLGLQKPQQSRTAPRLTLGTPIQIGTLAVVPIESTVPLSKDKYYTLSQAQKLGILKITETPGGSQVNSLEVRNLGDLPILLFAGELLLGGQQDRIVAKDSIVPAKERRDVPVFCVEHGRWSGKAEFKPADTFVPDQVRSYGYVTGDQSVVWAKVATLNSSVAASPSTGTIQGTLNDPKTKMATDKLFDELIAKFPKSPKTVGVMCWINGRILSADIFANHQVFDGSYSKLLRSYALDAQLEPKAKATPINVAACKKFLAEILSAKRDAGELSVGGRMFRMKGKVTGYEYGDAGFGGGFAGGKAAAGAPTSYGHGTYKPGGGRN